MSREFSQPEVADTVSLRPATEADQKTIKTIVHEAGINPRGLDWQRFLVAEDQGQIVGIGQIKPHSDGSRELASIAVIPERQEQGIASRIIQGLLEKETGPLYLMCLDKMDEFYPRFGFRRIDSPTDLPPYFRRMYRFARVFQPLSYFFIEGGARLRIMKRDGLRTS